MGGTAAANIVSDKLAVQPSLRRLFPKFAEIYQLREADLDFCSARSVSVSQCNLHLFSSACVQEGSGRVTVLDLHLCIAEASLTSAGRRHV